MSGRRVKGIILCGLLPLSLSACGDSGKLPPPTGGTGETTTTTTTTTGTGGSQGGGGQGGSQGGGGQGGSQGGGGQGGTGAACGNGIVEPGESCDGADTQGLDCQDLGFDMGTLGCEGDCTYDTSGCSGVEKCYDTLDNDGDGATDCLDSECAVSCANACTMPPVLLDMETVLGDTIGHAPLIEESVCTEPGSSAIAYQVTAAETGFLDVSLTAFSGTNLSVSVRSDCTSVASEIGCNDGGTGNGAIDFLSVPINQNDTVFVVVTGAGIDEPAPYLLYTQNRVPACADGVQDPTEQCDDGNLDADDGCSATCTLNATEVEPNNTVATANNIVPLFYGSISPAGDEDVIQVTVPNPGTSLIAQIGPVNLNGCVQNQLDSYLEILDPTGTIVLASDNDGGAGKCSKATASGLAAGAYYVRVKGSSITPTFPYLLEVNLVSDNCGDGVLTPGEQCDDGNVAAGDGCSPTCMFELDETEPNNTTGTANAYSMPPWYSSISPAGDVDVFSISLPGPSSSLSASVGDAGTGLCAMNQLDSYVEILGPTGTVIAEDDDSGPGWCSFASTSGLAAGTYYVRVKASTFLPNSTFLYSLTISKL